MTIWQAIVTTLSLVAGVVSFALIIAAICLLGLIGG